MKYWIIWDGTYSYIERSKEEPREDAGGPFKTFTEAKRELQEYYRMRISDARHALRAITKFKKSDLKGE